MWDVIIVGGGPGGAIAGKICADQGLKTLLLEMRKFPREKVCTGMIMSPMAQNLVEKEFGEIPRHILTTPKYLSGIWFHLMGGKDYKLKVSMPLTWRRDLDHWFIGKARQAGVQVWEKAKVIDLIETPQEYIVRLKKENKEIELKAKFIIGADGGTSVVRKYLFPQLKVPYAIGYRECYKIDLGLAKDHLHLFFNPEFAPNYFSIVHKGEFLLVELGARADRLKNLINQALHTLTKYFGFELGCQPLWRDGCVEPLLYSELFSSSFLPARGNILLVGDAAGIMLPISGEGIGTALKSGQLAAISIVEASRNHNQAGNLYLNKSKELLSKLQVLYHYTKQIHEQKDGNHQALLIIQAWREAISLS